MSRHVHSPGSRPASLRVAVVGGGIAGLSVASAFVERDPTIEVMVLEREATLAHHATGRSAAQFVVNYGAPALRPLTVLGKPFLAEPPPDLVDAPLLSPRPILFVAGPGHEPIIDEMLDQASGTGAELEELTPREATQRFGALRPERVRRAVIESGGHDIDVAGLHQAFVRRVRRAGGVLRTATRVDAVRRSSSTSPWRVETTTGSWEADVVVNAAGAWGDVVAARAGVEPVGLVPKRRTAFMVDGLAGAGHWPFLADAAGRFYLKPDGEQFLCSPSDATPSDPTDARPEEIDVAQAIDVINEHTTLEIRSVRSAWAGLRTFTQDEALVLGPDDARPDFLWCVGQGGTGIQTAWAAGQLVVDLALDGQPGLVFGTTDLDLAGLTVDRIRRQGGTG